MATGVTGVTANWTQGYLYDRYGNRTNVTASGITQNSQTVPTDGLASQSYDQPSNRINTSGYIYDLAGNLMRGQDASGNWQRYEYDAAGRLIHVKDDAGNDKLNNGYTSSRQRLVSWQPGVTDLTWFVWGGSSVIAEYKSTTWGNDPLVWQKSYIYAGSRLLSTYTNNGAGGETVEYHHPDRLGTKLVTNDAANTSFEQSTLPFGTALDAEAIGTNTTNQKFTSYDRSAVTGIDYAVNRSYSAAQGRFTSVDPIGMGATSIGNPQSMNLYAYVQNNPVDFTDPSGLLMAAPRPNIGTFTVTVTASWDDWYDHFASENGGDFGWLYDGPIDPYDPEPGGGGGGDDKRSENEKNCDKKLAGMFGGEGAIASSVYDPPTLSGGQFPNGVVLVPAHSAAVGIIHVYTNELGTKDTVGVYAPKLTNDKPKMVPFSKDATYNDPATGNYKETINIGIRAEYSNGLRISFNHVAPSKEKDVRSDGSFRVGNIGGIGGESVNGYNHTHIEFWRRNANGKKVMVDPRTLFCKEFGFK